MPQVGIEFSAYTTFIHFMKTISSKLSKDHTTVTSESEFANNSHAVARIPMQTQALASVGRDTSLGFQQFFCYA